MEHHADVAVPVAHVMFVETDYERPDGAMVGGRVLALGWWAGGPAEGEEPAGTLYLVADETLPRPVWCAQSRLTAFRLES